mgnify:CR=1 FL=1
MERLGKQLSEQETNPTPAEAYPFGKGAYSKEHLDYTIKTFQPYYKNPLSYQDAAEIVYNILDFVSVLRADARKVIKR